MKVLLNSFHLNGHTLGFHPQTKLESPCIPLSVNMHMAQELNTFHLNSHTL